MSCQVSWRHLILQRCQKIERRHRLELVDATESAPFHAHPLVPEELVIPTRVSIQ